MSVRLVCAVLFAVLATSYAQSRRCCYPDEFVTGEGITSGFSREGKPGVMYQNSSLAFDYRNRRMARFGSRLEPEGSVEFKEIFDYATRVRYEIDPKRRRCERFRLEESMPHCVPESATFYESLALGNNELIIDSFLISMRTERGMASGSLSVTQKDCLPASYLITETGDRDEEAALIITGFFNYQPKIVDPFRYFAIPEYCPKNVTEKSLFRSKFPSMFLLQ